MDDVQPQAVSRSDPDSGYFMALGYLQIGTGVLTLLMSLMALGQAMLGHGAMFDPVKVFGHTSSLIDQAISSYVSLQLSFGWIAGALQLAAGVCCLGRGSARLVRTASIVSLANFPHGTMAAILVLHGLSQRDTRRGERVKE